MKLFELRRTVDESGISGTGTVAQGVIFDTGWCALMWLTEHRSVAFYESLAEVIAIHGHNGKTLVIQIANCDPGVFQGLCRNRVQDECEGIGCDFDRPNHAYMWEQRGRFADMFREAVLNEAKP